MYKKIFTLTFVAAALLFSACQKSEGIYNPKQKIDKIFTEEFVSLAGREVATGKELSEDWTWDGDKLTRVDKYDIMTSELEESCSYTYDGNVLTRLSLDANNYSEFIYDGKKLSEVRSYENGKLESTLLITKRDGKKITEMKATTYDLDNDSKSTHLLQSTLHLFMPASAAEKIATLAQKRVATKDGKTETNIAFTWAGDNISQLEATEPGYRVYMAYEYDNKKSPYTGLGECLTETSSLSMWSSKNNIVYDSIIVFEDNQESMSVVVNYTYEYDGNWPVKRILEVTLPIGSATSNTYYEYK